VIESFFKYIFLMPQIFLIILVIGAFSDKKIGQWLGGLFISILTGFFLLHENPHLTPYESLSYFVILCLGFSIFPTLIAWGSYSRIDFVEILVAIQQFWLRVAFLFWCWVNNINLQHYTVYDDFGPQLVLGLFAILITSTFLIRTAPWPLIVQTIFTCLVINLGLTVQGSQFYPLFIWTLFVSIVPVYSCLRLGSKNHEFILRRLEYGASGGAAFWGALMLIHVIRDTSLTNNLLWTLLIALVGFFSWTRFGTSLDLFFFKGKKTESGAFVPKLVIQVIFLAAVVSYPFLMDFLENL